jgi:hypothetical protein
MHLAKQASSVFPENRVLIFVALELCFSAESTNIGELLLCAATPYQLDLRIGLLPLSCKLCCEAFS